MLRNLVTQLIQHDRIKTTLPKAQELKAIADQVQDALLQTGTYIVIGREKIIRFLAGKHKTTELTNILYLIDFEQPSR